MWRVAGADRRPHLDIGQPLFRQRRADLCQRFRQILLNVIRQRLERRDVNDLHLVLQPTVQSLPYQTVDCRQKGGERLTRAGGRGDQDVATLLNYGPGAALRLSRLGEAVGKPTLNDRMEAGQRHRTRNIPESGLAENLM